MTQNQTHQFHHRKVSAIRRDWKVATMDACRLHRVPRGVERIGLTIQGFYPNRSSLPDPDALAPTAKAILDGLCTGRSPDIKDQGWGLIPDDDGRYVAYVCLLAPVVIKGCQPGVRVIITEQDREG